MLAVKNGDSISTNYLLQRHLHGFKQREVVAEHNVLNELHQHFGVRNALELDATSHEVLLNGRVVLDDTVVYECQSPRSRVMRMSIGAAGLTMRCPSGMCDASIAADVLLFTERHQVGHFALGLIYIQAAFIVNQRHASAVITTILQSLETFNQNGIGFFASYIAYNSTHNI